MLELGGVATSIATPLLHKVLLHKVIICLPLSELSEVTTGVSLVKVTDGYKRRTRRCRRAQSMSG